MEQDVHNNGRRGAKRLRCLKSGHVLLGNGYSVLDCVVRNQSAEGVRLLSAETHIIPETFTLIRHLADGGRRADVCKITWRKPDQIGAKIVGPATKIE